MDVKFFFLPTVFNYLEGKEDSGVLGEVGAATHIGKETGFFFKN